MQSFAVPRYHLSFLAYFSPATRLEGSISTEFPAHRTSKHSRRHRRSSSLRLNPCAPFRKFTDVSESHACMLSGMYWNAHNMAWQHGTHGIAWLT